MAAGPGAGPVCGLPQVRALTAGVSTHLILVWTRLGPPPLQVVGLGRSGGLCVVFVCTLLSVGSGALGISHARV